MKPTQEQIKKFWEWCGFKYKPDELCGDPRSPHVKHAYGWRAPDDIKWQSEAPRVDLNNLFKYAVPKLQKQTLDVTLYLDCLSCPEAIIYRDNDSKEWITRDEDPALALFWAIWEVIKDETEA